MLPYGVVSSRRTKLLIARGTGAGKLIRSSTFFFMQVSKFTSMVEMFLPGAGKRQFVRVGLLVPYSNLHDLQVSCCKKGLNTVRTANTNQEGVGQ